MIQITPKVLTEAEALELINGADQCKPLPSGEETPPKFIIRVKDVLNHPVTQRLAQQIGRELRRAHVFHYPIGSKLNVHCDSGVFVDGKFELRETFTTTGIVYLDECGGGITFFPQHGVNVRPTPGLMIVHPSGPDYLHGVEPVWGKTRHTLIMRLA